MKDTTAQGVLFNDLLGKPIIANFDQPDSSSDGGTILLKACDRQLGLIDAIGGCLYAFAYILRPGDASAHYGAISIHQ